MNSFHPVIRIASQSHRTPRRAVLARSKATPSLPRSWIHQFFQSAAHDGRCIFGVGVSRDEEKVSRARRCRLGVVKGTPTRLPARKPVLWGR